MNAFQNALNAALPYPEWDTSKEPWEAEGDHCYRTNRTVLYDTERDGTIVMSVAVEQFAVLGQTPPPPVIDVYIADGRAKDPYTPQEVLDMGKAMIVASGLLQRLLAEAGDLNS